MDAVHSKSPIAGPDRELMRRLTMIVLFVLCFTAAFSGLYRLYTRKLQSFTGTARWIWAPHRINRNIPVVFFAARDFDLPGNRRFARVKIFADPEYTVWFNGRALAGRRTKEARDLDAYDVSTLARTAGNRIVVGVRSTNGVGGLIVSVDASDEMENIVVSDGSWRIFRRWSEFLPFRDIGPHEAPMVLGEPPIARWHFLRPRDAVIETAGTRIIKPVQKVDFVATIPMVKIVEGVAVATRKSLRATAYDFGFTSGRVRLTLAGHQPVPPVVMFRLANVKEEFGQIESTILSSPFALGEQSVIEPDAHTFRYVIVFGGRATADVVQ